MDLPLVYYEGVPRQVRKWEFWHKTILSVSILSFGAAMIGGSDQPTQTWAPAQVKSPLNIMGPTSVPLASKHMMALAAEPGKMPAASSSSLPSAQDMGITEEDHDAGSSSGNLLPIGTLIGLFAALLAASKTGKNEEFVMLATGPQDAQDAEKGNGRLEIRLQAVAQSAPVTREAVDQTGEAHSSAGIFVLPLLFTAYILQAYFYGSPIPSLLPRDVWLWLHCVGGMLFGGLVFSSTLYEALVILQGDPQVRHWWFKRVPDVDGKAMLPFLGLTFLSGVSLAQLSYRSLARSPPFVSFTLEMLVLFGVMWALLDHNTQGPAKKRCDEDYAAWQRGEYTAPEEIPGILKARLAVNAASCAFIPLLFWIMVTKPPYDIVRLLQH